MKIEAIVKHLEQMAPPYLKEEYDNVGLHTGTLQQETDGVLITLDVDERIVDEAIELNCGLIITHHPLVFGSLKRITGRTMQERCLIKAIRNDIAIYAIHTNIDNAALGLNHALATLLGVNNPNVLLPGVNKMSKVVTFCPPDHSDRVMAAMSAAGAGHIGNYDMCSFQTEGRGTFRALEGANPYVGELDALHGETELRIEMITPSAIVPHVVEAMKKSHPYEEVAYDVIPLSNPDLTTGSGAFGEISKPIGEEEFIQMVKEKLNVPVVRHTEHLARPINRLGVCGGSGAFLIQHAIDRKLDVLVTADVKYHQFGEASGKILLIDAGHYETEILVTSMIRDEIRKKFPTFACHITKRNTNPIRYS